MTANSEVRDQKMHLQSEQHGNMEGKRHAVCFQETAELGQSRHMTTVYYCKSVPVDERAHPNSSGCCTA